MRRFIISSPKFSGTAEVLYNEDNQLCLIDYTKATMNANQVIHFKGMVPVHTSLIEETFAASKLTIIETDYEVTFEMFWTKYDKKVNKARALPLFTKLNKIDQVKCYMGVDAYVKYLQTKETWRAKADPENYLRNRMWENEWK